MTLEPEELAKAASNLERLRQFFAVRGTWAVPPDASGPLAETARALRATEAEVGRMLARANLLPPSIDPPPPLEPLPAGSLDPHRLERFGHFAAQLEAWFQARRDSPAGSAGPALQQVHRALVLVDRALVPLVGAPATDPWDEPLDDVDSEVIAADAGSGPSMPVMAAGPASRPASTPAPTGAERVLPERPVGDRNDSLTLDPMGPVPLVEQRGEQVELSAGTRDLLATFYQEQGLELGASDRRNFERKVLRWVEAIPIGQVLIVKVTDLNGRPEPYARFQPRPQSQDE